jgi:hypothetical protein
MHRARRVLVAAVQAGVLLAGAWACGGRLDPLGAWADVGEGQDAASGVTPDAGVVLDAAARADAGTNHDAGVADVAVPDVDASLRCPDRATDAGLYCPPHETCVVWLAPDAAPYPSEGPIGQAPPDAGIVSAACSDASLEDACDGGMPAYLGYGIYGNQVTWAACVAP